MTKADRPITRETYTSVRVRRQSRPLIIEVCSTYVRVRAKGMRTSYTISMDQIYNMGAKNAANLAAEQRRNAKDARQARRRS